MIRELLSRFVSKRSSLPRNYSQFRSTPTVEHLEERTLLSVSTAIYSGLNETGLFSGNAQTQVAHIDFCFDEMPVVEDDGQGATVLLDGVDTWESEGDPILPYSNLTVLLPQGMDITSVTVSYGDPGEVIDSGIAMKAAPAPMAISEWTEPETYELVTTDFPVQDPVIFSTGSMRGYRLGNIGVYPVTYDAASETLLYHSDISLTVTAEPVAHTGELPVRNLAEDQAFVGMLIDNPEMLATYSATSGGSQTSLPSGTYEYVIITSQELSISNPDPSKYDFTDLINHKINNKGLTATIVTTEYIYANYDGLGGDYYTEPTGGDPAGKIRHFLRDAYENWGTRWVLLGGDVATDPSFGSDEAVVPVRYRGEIFEGYPCDIYYACLEGPMNYNGNVSWMQSFFDGYNGGNIDRLPDVCVGRVPVRTYDEINNIVAKTIQYEIQTHPNYDSGLLITDTTTYVSDLDKNYPLQIQEILQGTSDLREKSLLFRDCTISERHQYEMPYTSTEIISDLNASPHFVNHAAHANWNTNAKLNPQQVLDLTNSDPYILYSIGCYSGQLDRTGPLADARNPYIDERYCMAEAHVLAEHAAVAVVMNTRAGYGGMGVAEEMDNFFWDTLFADHKQDIYLNLGRRIGVAHIAYMVDLFSNNPNIGKFGLYSPTLFGDPELQFQVDLNRVDSDADLGEVDYRAIVDLNLNEEAGNSMVGDRDHELQTANNGYLTIIAQYEASDGNVDLI